MHGIARDTIAAIATPPGRGGIGVVRVSGARVSSIAEQLIGGLPKPREARFARFRDALGQVIDEGLVLYFPRPYSFTGEDVLEFQGHGSPVVLDQLLQRLMECGVRLAGPGEFSQRAFLNGKLDLAQAEAVADLIESGTAEAARLALRSLDGEFSRRIHDLVERITHLRMYVEAAIDFPEEEIDFLADGRVTADLATIQQATAAVVESARIGRLLRDGMTLVIAGAPNAGKSSLLNALSGRESAIVTEIPGTTRDLLREQIQIDGMPLHIVDTAGLRESPDRVEQEGIRRAREQIERADLILWVYDAEADPRAESLARADLPPRIPLTRVRNKIDRLPADGSERQAVAGESEIPLSTKTGEGLERLREHLKHHMGYHGSQEGEFLARRRHLDALGRAATSLDAAMRILQTDAAGDLAAEDLRQAQNALSEITGEFTPEDLLDRIFADFCIGK